MDPVGLTENLGRRLCFPKRFMGQSPTPRVQQDRPVLLS